MRFLDLYLIFLKIVINSCVLTSKKWAFLNITTISLNDNKQKQILFTDSALFSISSPNNFISGQLIQALSIEKKNEFDESNGTITNNGCNDYINQNLPNNYIALVSRGNCLFDKKVQVAFKNKAIGVLVYNNDYDLITMYLKNNSIPSIMITQYVGNLLIKLLKTTTVYVTVKPGPIEFVDENAMPSRSSIYFVAFAFLTVVLVTFIWLTIYYIQKYRYLTTKKKLNNKLKKATIKALSKMKIRKLINGDKELNESCAICLENFQISDQIRDLPCGHYFHQKDVDVWLMEHRNCPMCKLNILQACGIELNRPNTRFRRFLNVLRLQPHIDSTTSISTMSATETNSQNAQIDQNIISPNNTNNQSETNETNSNQVDDSSQDRKSSEKNKSHSSRENIKLENLFVVPSTSSNIANNQSDTATRQDNEFKTIPL